MVDVEAAVIEWANDHGLPATFGDVPRDRPYEFFTVERVGGTFERFRDLPMVAVQAWAGTRAEASLLAQSFVEAANSSLRYHPKVARLNVNSIANFPSSEGEPRYQILMDLVTA